MSLILGEVISAMSLSQDFPWRTELLLCKKLFDLIRKVKSSVKDHKKTTGLIGSGKGFSVYIQTGQISIQKTPCKTGPTVSAAKFHFS